jgi:hypothetical protein
MPPRPMETAAASPIGFFLDALSALIEAYIRKVRKDGKDTESRPSRKRGRGTGAFEIRQRKIEAQKRSGSQARNGGLARESLDAGARTQELVQSCREKEARNALAL